MIGFILSFVLSFLLLPMVMDMLKRANVVCENFQSKLIPFSLGILFVFIQLITLGILNMVFRFEVDLLYIIGVSLIGFLGLLDDLIGEKNIKGLKGHILEFFKGRLTTGALKGFIGIFVSLLISTYLSKELYCIIIDTLLISLFTNLMNLFDLRPGRAVKLFIFISLIFILSNFMNKGNYILYSIIGILIPYFSFDLKSKAMMGDVGSNVLGFTLGFYASVNLNMSIKSIILIILFILHIIAEKFSFSDIIKSNRILSYFDKLGR